MQSLSRLIDKNSRTCAGAGIGTARIHVDRDSPHFPRHHANWRLRSMVALDRGDTGQLHYSSVISLSRADAQIIKHTMLECLQKTEKILALSQEEALFCQNLDFFEL